MLINVPFRGLTNFARSILVYLRNIGVLGEFFISFATRPSKNNFVADFNFSKLYGFSSPFGHFSDIRLSNWAINFLRLLFFPLLQIMLNIVILPLIDTLSLMLRASLSIINPLTRLAAYGVGLLLKNFGFIWDNSLGVLFKSCNYGLTTACNWLEMQSSTMKQQLLSEVHTQRLQLYLWAFQQEDKEHHKVLTDEEYYLEPHRYELLYHSDSSCLLNKLLKPQSLTREEIDNTHYLSLFSSLKREKEVENEENLLPTAKF